jgi:hypothetical protein
MGLNFELQNPPFFWTQVYAESEKLGVFNGPIQYNPIRQ